MSDDSLPAESLILQAKRDRGAINSLLAKYRPYLRLAAQRRLAPRLSARTDGSDIVQETLLLVGENFNKFKGDTEHEFTAWVEKIQENVITNMARRHIVAIRRSVTREQSLASADGSASLYWYELAATDDANGSARLVSGEKALILAEKIDALSAPQREAIRLRFFEQMTVDAIAKQMDKNPAAVSALIYRGTNELRKALQDDG